MNKKILSGTIHKVPQDLKKILISNQSALEKWNNLTPLARNEWICWITIVKKQETRENHLKRLSLDLAKGKRRPCCWPGCPHHRENAQKWFKK
jgi:uncharacterized protein YdeI (YjbR/CyaY-like superfamily)